MSSRRVGVAGFELEGELNVNNRFREGVVGRVEEVALAVVRSGDPSLNLGGVTSVCRSVWNSVLACSEEESQKRYKTKG